MREDPGLEAAGAPSPLTRRRAWQLSWPMIFANAAVPFAGLVDTAVIGAVGDKADLGGVSLGTTLFNLFYWSFYFLRMASTGQAAQASGAGRREEIPPVLLRALALGAVLGVLVLLGRHAIDTIGFGILQGGPRVETAGSAYFLTRVWGAPASYALFALTGWLIGLGRTRAVLWSQVLFSLLNIVLDLVFVLGFGWGVRGVAGATAIAEVAAALVAGWLAWVVIREESGPAVHGALHRLWDLAAIRRLMVINLDMMVRNWALLAGFSWFANAGARQGAAILAGNHVLLQIVTVWAFVLDAFAFTAETAVGRAYGAKVLTDLRHAIRVTSELAVAAGAVFLVLTLALGPPLLTVWIADPEARASAIRFLPFCAVIPLIGSVAWQLDGIFSGAMRSGAMRNASVAAVVCYISLDLVLTPAFGPRGMWVAWLCYYVARAATLAVAYPRLERTLEG